MRAITPAAKFSVTTSETATSSREQLLAALAARRSIVMPSFSTLWLLNPPPRSMPRRSSTNGGAPRRMSHVPWRTGSSTRITWAPNAARNRVAPAPASWPVRSQMRRCESAPTSAHPHGHRGVAAHGAGVHPFELGSRRRPTWGSACSVSSQRDARLRGGPARRRCRSACRTRTRGGGRCRGARRNVGSAKWRSSRSAQPLSSEHLRALRRRCCRAARGRGRPTATAPVTAPRSAAAPRSRSG